MQDARNNVLPRADRTRRADTQNYGSTIESKTQALRMVCLLDRRRVGRRVFLRVEQAADRRREPWFEFGVDELD